MMRTHRRTIRSTAARHPTSGGPGCLQPGWRKPQEARSGATLVEVLMALMVMGIGVVAVATLFPIAVLRSLQATQLTNATILRLNAEAMMDVDRNLVHAVPTWRANTAYGHGDVVKATTSNNRFFRFNEAGGGTSGGSEPSWNTTVGGPTDDNGSEWVTLDSISYIVDPLGWHEFDQIGSPLRGKFGNDSGTALGDESLNRYHGFPIWEPNTFYPTGTTVLDPAVSNRLFRCTTAGTSDTSEPMWDTTLNGTTTEGTGVAWTALDAEVETEQLVTLPDSWVTTGEGFTSNQTAVSVDVTELDAATLQQISVAGEIDTDNDGVPEVDRNGNNVVDVTESRIILFDTTGRHSVTRIITLIDPTNQRIHWSEDVLGVPGNGTLDPDEDLNGNGVIDDYKLPPTFIEDQNGNGSLDPGEDINGNGTLDMNVGQAVIETKERRYTWLLTVREDPLTTPATSLVDVVVFFRRAVGPLDEQIVGGTDIDSDGTIDNIAAAPGFTDGRHYQLPAGVRPEALSKGGYLFDVDNARWYRVVVFDEQSGGIVLTLNRATPAGETLTRAIFMRGVVDVYPLKSKS